MEKTKTVLTRSLVEIGIFSAVVNLLLLVQPIYLLQVYDRILPASSISTLVYLSIMVVAAMAVLGLLEVVRSLYANRMAARIEATSGSEIFLAAMNSPRAGLGDVQPLRDMSTIRSFVASRAMFFLFDLPFAPLFILILYFVHPVLFLTTIVGAVVMIGVALANQAATGKKGREATEKVAGTMNAAQSFARNFETVRALGMVSNAVEYWGGRYSDSLRASSEVASVNAFYGGLARTVRMLLQIAILGIGAFLVLEGEMTAGMIFASSLISGRALQPLDQIVGSWRQVMDTWQAWKRVSALVTQPAPKALDDVELPEPKGALAVDQLTYFLPEADPGAPPLIKRISFNVRAGETVAVVGPSQAGKSTLARLIVGAIAPRSGVVRLDGADIRNWDSDKLGRHIGYLSQEVELFPGTIAQNIARFDLEPSDEDIVLAAQHAHVHDLILAQKNGYSTRIGPMGVRLSGGERQRIGLARAFYGQPKLLVLDEPNSNLDTRGEQALEQAILEAKARGITVLVITHRISIATKCDRILALRDGQIELYGPAQEVLLRLAQGAQRTGPQAPAEPQPAAPTAPAGNVQPIKGTAATSFGGMTRLEVK